MKTKIFSLLAMVLLCANIAAAQSPQPINLDYRDVYWMHGLNGNQNSLSLLANHFGNKYKINSLYYGYEATSGIAYAASTWQNLALDRRPDNFVVSHSMGGLVARYYDANYPNKRFGGLITMACPHLGSHFADAFGNGNVAKFFDGVCNSGTEGYTSMLEDVNFFLKLLRKLTMEEYLADFCGNINNNYIPRINAAMDDVGGFVISKYVAGKIGRPTFITNIQIWADTKITNLNDKIKELGEGLVDIAASFVFGNGNREQSINDLKYNNSLISSIPAFHNEHTINLTNYMSDTKSGAYVLGSTISATLGENKDFDQIKPNRLIDIMEALAKNSDTLKQKYQRIGNATNLGGIATIIGAVATGGVGLEFAILLFKSRGRCRATADALQRQANFWRYNFHTLYNNCLGTQYTETVEEWIEEPIIEDPCREAIRGGGIVERLESPNLIEQPCRDYGIVRPGLKPIERKKITYTVTRHYQNDGIVIRPSQEGWKDVKKVHIGPYDHEQVKTSNVTKNVFDDIFKGKYDPFFACELR